MDRALGFLLVLIHCFIPGASSLAQGPVQALVYISNKDGGFDIYRNNLTGTEEVRLTSDPGWEWMPRYLRSEKLILFNAMDTNDNFATRVMDIDGKPKILVGVRLDREFSIPVNTLSMAYTVKNGDATNIFISDTSADSTAITNNSFYNGRPVWAHEGDRLAYISDRTGSNEIFLYTVSDESTRQLTNNNGREKYISWSPDGGQIAFTMRNDSSENDIFIIDIASGIIEQLTETRLNESEIAWSLCGQYIAYHAKVNDSDDIFVLDLSDGNVRQITTAGAYHGEPAWIYMD